MDRNDIVRIGNSTITNRVSEKDIREVISDYCYEHKKGDKMTALLLDAIFRTGVITSYFFEALEYYITKFAIIRVYAKPVEGKEKQVIIML